MEVYTSYLAFFYKEIDNCEPAKALHPEYGALIATGERLDPRLLKPTPKAKQEAMQKNATSEHYCCECGEWRPLTMYGKRSNGRPDSYCKSCRSKVQKRYRMRKRIRGT